MKIGMVLDKSFPPDGRVENEARQLIKNGHDVHLFCLNLNNKPEYEVVNGIIVHRYSFSKKILKKIVPLAYTIPLYHLLLKKRIRTFLSKLDLDVIHIHDMIAAKAVFDIGIDIPIILDLHENRPAIMKYYTHVNSGLGKVLIDLKKWKKIEFQLIQKADNVVVVTPEAKKYYLNNVEAIKKEKIICAPNTIDVNIFLNYKIEKRIINQFKDYFTILYLGAVDIRRGLDTVIKSVAKLNENIPTIKFVIVGGKSRDMVTLKKMVEKYQVNEHIDFEGWQNLTLFPSYIQASNVCISPIKRNLHHDTTFANKLFQYMSVGKPVIVSDCPPQKRVVETENCGLFFEADNIEDLSDKILKLYNNRNFRETLGKNGKKAVQQKYNWDLTGKGLVKLYKNLNKGE